MVALATLETTTPLLLARAMIRIRHPYLSPLRPTLAQPFPTDGVAEFISSHTSLPYTLTTSTKNAEPLDAHPNLPPFLHLNWTTAEDSLIASPPPPPPPGWSRYPPHQSFHATDLDAIAAVPAGGVLRIHPIPTDRENTFHFIFGYFHCQLMPSKSTQ